MPPHQRHMPQEAPQGSGQRVSGGAQNIFSKINGDITALNSSILLISQKIKYLVRNEKILGRNLLVVNRKLKESLEGRAQGGTEASADFERTLSSISTQLNEVQEKLAVLESEVGNIKQNYAKAEEVSEIKYLVNSINPLEFATLKDVQELTAGGKGPKGKK